MFGSAIGLVFEWFYSQKIWQKPDPVQECLRLIPEAINQTYINEQFIKGSDPSYDLKLLGLMKQYVPSGVEIIRQNRLLTDNSLAEVDLTVIHADQSGNEIKLVGRADFIHYEPSGPVILDGKASKYRDKYVDTTQLLWYSLQHYAKYHTAPVRIGFIFWHFPDNPITWISYSGDDLKKEWSKTVEVVSNIKSKHFEPLASGHCYRCNFRHLCDDGQKYLSSKKSNNNITDSIFTLESI
jgi:hypothetical protein